MARRSPAGWQQQPPGWGPPAPFGANPGQPSGRRLDVPAWTAGRGWLALMVAGVLVVTVRVVSHQHRLAGAGWATIGLAAVVAVLLSVHRHDGGRWLVRVLAEYTVVALLAVLLAGGGAHPAPAADPDRPATAATAGALCPKPVRAVAGGLCKRLDGWWRTARAADTPPPTTTTPHGKHR